MGDCTTPKKRSADLTFARVIIAEAMQNNCTLVSKDATIATYPDIKALW